VTKAKADSSANNVVPVQSQEEETQRAGPTKTSESDDDDDDYGPAAPDSIDQRRPQGPKVPTLEDIQDRRGKSLNE